MQTPFGMSLFALCAATASAISVTVTPWCNNSFRIQVSPQTNPGEEARLLEKLGAIPSALVDACNPGTPSTLSPGAPLVTNGNAAIQLLANGSLQLTRADTSVPLFTATYDLRPLNYTGTCARGRAAYGSILREQNLTLAAAAALCETDVECAAFSAMIGPVYACDTSLPLDNTTAVPVQFMANQTFTDGNALWRSWAKPSLVAAPGFLSGYFNTVPGDASERIFGLGQGGWTLDGGCAVSPQSTQVRAVMPIQSLPACYFLSSLRN